jgi:hypothetical protein
VKKCAARIIQALDIGDTFEVTMEKPVASLGIKLRDNFVATPKGNVCDFAVTDRKENRLSICDVVIYHPDPNTPSDWEPRRVVLKAEQEKRITYAKWNMSQKDIIPLAFTTYLDWADSTFEWFKAITMELAGNNRRKASQYMRRVRERIGVAIVRGQGRVVDELNNQNRRWGGIQQLWG